MFITREIVLRRCVLRRCVYFSFYKFLSANCPAGTYYGGGKCVECPIGYYQDQEKQLSCLKCPTDKGTVKPGAKHCQSEFLTNYTYNTTFTPLLHSHHYTHTTTPIPLHSHYYTHTTTLTPLHSHHYTHTTIANWIPRRKTKTRLAGHKIVLSGEFSLISPQYWRLFQYNI